MAQRLKSFNTHDNLYDQVALTNHIFEDTTKLIDLTILALHNYYEVFEAPHIFPNN